MDSKSHELHYDCNDRMDPKDGNDRIDSKDHHVHNDCNDGNDHMDPKDHNYCKDRMDSKDRQVHNDNYHNDRRDPNKLFSQTQSMNLEFEFQVHFLESGCMCI